MLYLSGAVRPELARAHPRLGFIVTPLMGNRLPAGRPWGADNGYCTRPDRYSDAGYLRWLAGRDPSRCLFATAPDVVGDAAATLARSLPPMLPRIRAAGYPAALVAQDGLERLAVPWDEIDCLLVGGSTAWKLSDHARQLVAAGKWVHVGRVNSRRRFLMMSAWGADSADGTFICFGPDKNLHKVLGWLEAEDRARAQGSALAA